MKLKKTLAAILALLMAVAMLPLSSMHAKAESTSGEFDVSGSKTASPTELDWEHRETTVTLSLPSAEYQNEIDIVFTMDSSSSAKYIDFFRESVTSLFSSILENNPNVRLKIGVIRFRGAAHDALAYLSEGAYSGLVVYNDDTKELIQNALTMSKEAVEEAFGHGSSTHAGMDIADEWLTADTEVPNDHKYVVLLTDGKTYIWNNENNEPTTIYSQYYAAQKGNPDRWVMQKEGVPDLNQSACQYKNSYPVDVSDMSGKSNIFWFNNYQDLYDCTSEELTGVSPWDAPCTYAFDGSKPTGTATKHEVTNGEALFGSNSATYGNKNDYKYYWEYTPDSAWEGVPYLEGNPFEVIRNSDGSYTFDTNSINPDYYMYHVDCLQKGMYMAGHLWTEMNSKYNCAVITYTESGATGFVDLRKSFNSWLRANSKYGAEMKDSSDVQALFTGIDNSIRYMVSKGTVTDTITDDFTLLSSDQAGAFRMTKSGKELPVTYSDGKWSFDTANEEGVYPYEVTLSGQTLTWTINVPIENANPITLSYDLQIREDATTDFYNTNVVAELEYVSTDDVKGTYEFEVPEVSYIAPTEVIVEKVWEDANNQDGVRPDKVVMTLLKDGEPETEANLSEENEWTYTFTDIPEAKLVEGEFVAIEYTVEELAVEGYEGAITSERVAEETAGEASTATRAEETAEAETTEAEGETEAETEEEKGTLKYTITNTHNPEVIEITGTKTWDDANDVDGIRPKSITINLLADGTKVKSLEVKETDGKFTWTFTEMPKYKDGKEIVYTITEDAVEGYTATVDGFNVTNKHVPVNPPTGDPNQIPVLAIAGVSALLTMIILIIIQTMRRKAEN
ncbi:MAG: Cna B-type domain-containing protein [Firmicutes bacterium]|nr:Cna B-type domain-containing protein [Bacillota bacterium]